MVGIIVVSHSFLLGQEIIKLCNEMKKNNFEIINCSGLDKNTFGSDPIKIKEAIENNIKGNEGVFVFCDLGSSILNSQLAIDLIEDESIDKSKIIIADAPIVEGTLVASTLNFDGNFNQIIDELKQLKTFDKTK
ncbi:diguanylate cyclase [Malacoplasma penetrans]|uniref:phosphoenolpyruvate--glycerone phosphotransferase n=1 Tax=Malacoplasma penetrans (strain HF-2) TaxID=272633 RepID=Q8EW69_MALP2|nr:dihydroxyacetone kinase phosphoryl donor subunit DhaM [Malacoplasma penetrans]RXY96626.1 diguanylate cyclase [Malacoplasma penetrans]BAC44127.1 PTS system enzyme I [Malacoplasma penetrans HF-2]